MGRIDRYTPRDGKACGLMIICCTMLLLAVPRLVASVYALYPETLLKQTKPLSDELYFQAIDDLDAALQWHDDPRYWQLQGLCYLNLFDHSLLPGAERAGLLDKAIQAMTHGLTASPVDPFAWFRLAVALDLAAAPVEKIAAAYRLSLYAGRVEPELLMPRLKFGYKFLEQFDIELRGLWLKQIPLAYQFQFTELVRFALQSPGFKPFVETVFLLDKDKLQRFNQSFENTYQQALKAPAKR